MDDKIKIVIAGGLLFAAYYLNFVKRGQGFSAKIGTNIIDSANSVINSTGANMAINYNSVLDNANIQAFLKLIRTGEGTSDIEGYNRLFGGSNFSSYADHPNIVITAKNGLKSTAAGAYQILYRTWLDLKNNGVVLPDFSPANQDKAAIALINRRNALNYIVNGDFVSAINLLNKEWASLPGSPYGQPTLTMQKALTVLAQNGGSVSAT